MYRPPRYRVQRFKNTLYRVSKWLRESVFLHTNGTAQNCSACCLPVLVTLNKQRRANSFNAKWGCERYSYTAFYNTLLPFACKAQKCTRLAGADCSSTAEQL